MTAKGLSVENPENVDEILTSIVSQILGVSAEAIKRDTNLMVAYGLDSLGRVEVMALVESTFNVVFPEASIAAITTIDELAELLQKLLTHFEA